MIRKKDLLSNLSNYTPEEIAGAVNDGIVSLYELGRETGGAFTPLLRRKVKEIIANGIPQSTADIDETLEEQRITSEVKEDFKIEPIAEDSSEVPDLTSDDSIQSNAITDSQSSTMVVSSNANNKGMFSAPFSFKGRIRRTEYGLSYIIYAIWYVIFIAIGGSMEPNPVVAFLMLLSMAPAYWFMLAQGCKRCHDRGNSGWFQIIPFYFLWMLFAPGEDGENGYGENPKKNNSN